MRGSTAATEAVSSASIYHSILSLQITATSGIPDNRSVLFGLEPDGRALARNDRVSAPAH